MWSKLSESLPSVSRDLNSSNAAISVVRAPESCSSIPFTMASGRTPRRSNDALTIGLRRRGRIELQRTKSGYGLNGGHTVTNRQTKDLTDIGGWVSADQKDTPSLISEVNGRGAGERRLTDPPSP